MTLQFTDINYFIVNPHHLHNYLKNDFETNCKFIKNIIDKDLDEKLINKLLDSFKIYILKYKTVAVDLNAKTINNKHYYFLHKAREEARKSLLNHKHGCIITYKNKIVSSGHNKSSIYNNKSYRSIHAEIDAINKLVKISKFQNKSVRNNCSLYVVRIQNGSNHFKMSKPCKNCIENIIKNNIGIVYYSTNETFIDDLICQFIKESI